MWIPPGRLAEEDPTFRVSSNEETGQTEISGMGELHLEILVDRMKREFKVEANVGRRQVSYRETLPGEGFDFVSKIKGGAVPTEFIPAIEKGCEEAMETGVRAGYPMVDVRVTLVDGKYHDPDSSEIAFKIAGSLALTGGARGSKAARLDPVMAAG